MGKVSLPYLKNIQIVALWTKIVALFGKKTVALFLALLGKIVALLNFKLLSTLRVAPKKNFKQMVILAFAVFVVQPLMHINAIFLTFLAY